MSITTSKWDTGSFSLPLPYLVFQNKTLDLSTLPYATPDVSGSEQMGLPTHDVILDEFSSLTPCFSLPLTVPSKRSC